MAELIFLVIFIWTGALLGLLVSRIMNGRGLGVSYNLILGVIFLFAESYLTGIVSFQTIIMISFLFCMVLFGELTLFIAEQRIDPPYR